MIQVIALSAVLSRKLMDILNTTPTQINRCMWILFIQGGN